ncbi:MAG: xylose isomerase [Planctomycetota bacterium]|nr:MAG: xylose isomerase [Planctomycetota bacterium]
MSTTASRREFLTSSAAAFASLSLAGRGLLAAEEPKSAKKAPLFKISLAEWSLNKALFGKKLDNLDFPKTAKEDFGIEAVEYVNQFFKDKAKDEKYLADLKMRCSDLGVTSVLIMCDGEGSLGDPNNDRRTKAVENHYRWVEAAKFLGCHSIRVNAHSEGSFEEQQKLAADGLRRLSEFGAKHDIGVIVENHGGNSSNGKWLAGVMKMVDMKNCGTLPDFGNFGGYDRYQGVTELMPFAKGVSAKSHDFDAEGNETKTDYRKMMKIVLEAGYRGWVGIEYEGGKLSEPEGIKATKKLLEKVREEMSA